MFLILAEGETGGGGTSPPRRCGLLVLVAADDVDEAQRVALETLGEAGWEEVHVNEVGQGPQCLPTIVDPRLMEPWRTALDQGCAIIVQDVA